MEEEEIRERKGREEGDVKYKQPIMFYLEKPLKNRFGRMFNARSSGPWIIRNVLDTQLYGLSGGCIKPEDFPEPEKEVYKRAFQPQQMATLTDLNHPPQTSGKSASFQRLPSRI
jgi:hypothetical protein